jgi:hypothetical protein
LSFTPPTFGEILSDVSDVREVRNWRGEGEEFERVVEVC